MANHRRRPMRGRLGRFVNRLRPRTPTKTKEYDIQLPADSPVEKLLKRLETRLDVRVIPESGAVFYSGDKWKTLSMDPREAVIRAIEGPHA